MGLSTVLINSDIVQYFQHGQGVLKLRVLIKLEFMMSSSVLYRSEIRFLLGICSKLIISQRTE